MDAVRIRHEQENAETLVSRCPLLLYACASYAEQSRLGGTMTNTMGAFL